MLRYGTCARARAHAYVSARARASVNMRVLSLFFYGR